ncbi:hypothetical protein ACSBR2_002224 [Camellia fascicularis]
MADRRHRKDSTQLLSICIAHWTPTISEKPYNIRCKCCLSSEHLDHLHTNTLNSVYIAFNHRRRLIFFFFCFLYRNSIDYLFTIVMCQICEPLVN